MRPINQVLLLPIIVAMALLASCASHRGDGGETGLSMERCAPDSEATSLQGSRLRICGIINQRLVDSISSIETPISALYIESRGGGEPSTYQLAQLVNAREIEVHFVGICASACISFYLQAERVTVGPEALFLAHASAYGRVFMVTRSDEWRDRFSEHYDGRAIASAHDVLEAISLGYRNNVRDYSLESTAAIGPICAGGLADNRLILSQAGNLLFRSEYDFWILTQESLIRWRSGLSADGSLSTYDETIRQRLLANQSFFQGRRLRPILIDDQVRLAGEWMRSKPSFDLCETQGAS
ncbi:hypothetical protein [uncultured Maricaulis sp.]|uniref:hypothetical protein n=1 Tax=uncultured Maricaulis sp. TaxID=174710 RepID=UPI0030DCC537